VSTSSGSRSSPNSVLSTEVLREIRNLHFQTRKLADQGIVGRYRSAYRGTGIEFEEVREYVPGDDVRRLDWKVTARSGRAFIKSYREERELTVMIAIDVSGSNISGTKGMLRGSLAARVGAVLSMIALTNNDKVGLCTFSDQVECYQPPRKARSAVWRILHEVLAEREKERRGTNLSAFFRFLSGVLKRKSIIFVISDYFDSGYERALATLAKKHDVTALVISDPADKSLPRGGLTLVEDPETGFRHLLDLGDRNYASQFSARATELQKRRDEFFVKHGIGLIELQTDEAFMPKIRRYFELREHQRAMPHI